MSLQDGRAKNVEVLPLWLQDSSELTLKLTSIAPEDKFNESRVYDALLSATLIEEH